MCDPRWSVYYISCTAPSPPPPTPPPPSQPTTYSQILNVAVPMTVLTQQSLMTSPQCVSTPESTSLKCSHLSLKKMLGMFGPHSIPASAVWAPFHVDILCGWSHKWTVIPHRWSTIQPVPFLGDDNTPIEDVNAFYDFW